MLLEIVASFVAGMVFDYLPTKNQVSVVNRDQVKAAASAFGVSIQDQLKITAVTAIVGGCDKPTAILCGIFFGLGIACTTYVMLKPERSGSTTEEETW